MMNPYSKILIIGMIYYMTIFKVEARPAIPAEAALVTVPIFPAKLDAS